MCVTVATSLCSMTEVMNVHIQIYINMYTFGGGYCVCEWRACVCVMHNLYVLYMYSMCVCACAILLGIIMRIPS